MVRVVAIARVALTIARAHAVPSIRAILDWRNVTPGLVVSIQTFGSYAANFHPHGQALITDASRRS